MNNTEIILEYLEDIHPKVACDDCISSQVGVRPRQQVHQICTRLSSSGSIARTRGVCSSCCRHKLVNSLTLPREAPPGEETEEPAPEEPIDLEKRRNEVVRICHALWRSAKGVPPPRSISKVICQLREEGHLPGHQANMMLTLCNLRNVYVYCARDVRFGPNEWLVAQGAWAIVQEWWESAGAMLR